MISPKAFLALLALPVFAEPESETSPWEITGAAGLSYSDGNSDRLATHLQLLATRVTPENELFLNADYFYAEDDRIATTDNLRLGAQFNHLVQERRYFGFSAQFLTDPIADLDHRIDISTLLGWYALKEDRQSLAFEMGPGYTWETQAGSNSDFLNLRLAERYERRLGDASKLWQSLAFVPEAADFDNHLLTAELGIESRITDHWNLRTFVRYQRDHSPAPGREENDLSLMLGVGYSLGGFPDPEKSARKTLKPARKTPTATPTGWTRSASLGTALASGNSDSRSLTSTFETAYHAATHEFFAGAEYLYGEDDGDTSQHQFHADARLRRLFGSRRFLGAGVELFHDDLADLSYRFTPSATAGTYLVKNDAVSLSLEAGPGYTFEKAGGQRSDYLSLVAAERFAFVIAPRLTFKQSLVWEAEAAELDNHTLTAAANLDTDLTESLALRIGLTYLFDPTPATGRAHHDTTLTSGIAVKF